jgi:SAM-dependent methyltransferase
MKNEWEVRAQNDFIHAVTGNVHKDDFWESGQEIIDELIEPYLERLELNPATSRAMEIGAGAGRVVIPLSKTFESVVAVDVSRTMLDLARKSATEIDNISFIETNGMQLEGIDDNSIDLASSFFVFHHMPTLDAIKANLSEVNRVVQPGGAFIIDISYRRGGWWRTKRGTGFPIIPRRLLWMLPWKLSVWIATRRKKVVGGTVNTWFGAKPMSTNKIKNIFTECGLTVEAFVPSISPRNIVVIGRKS